ncbi:hypothetical protein PGT21_011828 [Puccinia graminis f. sp. tritici]|uniref:Uncharacterized protein n=1 Tax=Puccinia graminis f. sp. tritici TaxID=56615 RepID=A0A5B0P6T7_PUCGR|nr:hypothetical protein PGT21_011828 [Puccinia graminis f. sp. tritici]
MFLAQGTTPLPISENLLPNTSSSTASPTVPGHRRRRTSDDEGNDHSPHQRRRPNADDPETTLINPFLDLEHPDPAEDLPDPETLNATRTPAENLARNLGLEMLTTQQAGMFSEIPHDEQATLIMSTLAAVLKRLDTLTQQQANRATVDTPPAAHLSLAEQIRIFKFSPEAKEFLRQQGREAMMHSDLEAYTEDTRDRGLFRIVLDGINRQPEAYLRAQFPPGFVAQDRLAMNHCHTEVKRQLKNVRHQLRNILLTGVVAPASNQDLPPIPNLTRLSRDVWRFLMGTVTRLSNEEVDARVIPLLKIRIAYLRLATMDNHFDPMARTISQWDQIDSQLQANRERAVNFTNLVIPVPANHSSVSPAGSPPCPNPRQPAYSLQPILIAQSGTSAPSTSPRPHDAPFPPSRRPATLPPSHSLVLQNPTGERQEDAPARTHVSPAARPDHVSRAPQRRLPSDPSLASAGRPTSLEPPEGPFCAPGGPPMGISGRSSGRPMWAS